MEKADVSGLDWLILSLGTDGIDGPTDAAGAWADPRTIKSAHALGLAPAQYLDDNDSYGFFKQTGNLIMTGPTGTNVMDLRVFLLRAA
ncbi:MAG: MOFRL family protein, partial [Candidatus Aminicenantales bacterium]